MRQGRFGRGGHTRHGAVGSSSLWAVALISVLAGCGSSAAPPEPPNESGAAIRTYLANHYLLSAWFQSIEDVTASGTTATVTTSLPSTTQGQTQATQVCQAVLRSGKLTKAVVLLADTTQVCTPARPAASTTTSNNG